MKKISLIPIVNQLEITEGYFNLSNDCNIIIIEKRDLIPAQLLALSLRLSTGFKLPVIHSHEIGKNNICLSSKGIDEKDKFGLTDEEYSIDITKSSCRLIANTVSGLFPAVQTLLQLFPDDVFSEELVSRDWNISCVEINDKPRFKWRGVHLDVARHFYNKDEVKRIIDLISLYKFNKLHLHLTDDQGWRIEILRYPKLTEVGATRESTLIGHGASSPKRYDDIPYGGYFTQNDIKDIVSYASKRGIDIIPEIDMPGHMQAAIAAYPELGCLDLKLNPMCHWGISHHILNVRESTIEFITNVLSEIIELFPGDYIHLGGDEVPKLGWSEQREFQDRLVELKLKDEDELQNWFINRISDFVVKNKKKVLCWDEVIDNENINKDVVVMNWRSQEQGIKALKLGHNVICTPESHVYFDHYQSYLSDNEPLAIGGCTTTEKVYSFDPIPEDLEDTYHKNVLGSQGLLWTEYIANLKHLEYMAFPRLCALSEALWIEKSEKCYKDFVRRLNSHRGKFQILNVNAHSLP